MNEQASEKVNLNTGEIKNSNVRPCCPKCGGVLIPEKSGRYVVSVGCVYCGERFYRDYPRRSPDSIERDAHKHAGRPCHCIDGRRRA